VAAVEGRRLSVLFTTPTLARQFSEGVHIEVLREALREVLGVDLEVVCLPGVSTAPAPVGQRPAGQRPAGSGPVGSGPASSLQTPVHEGFAPGDEAADDDGSEPPVERGEDAALRLVQQALGGRVLDRRGD